MSGSEDADADAPRTSPRRLAAGAGVGRNFIAMMIWQVSTYLVPLVTFPYLTRVVGPSQFGVLGFSSAMALYGTVLVEWGFNLSGPRAVVECRDRPQTLNELIWSTLGAKACMCLFSLGLLFAVYRLDKHVASLGVVVFLSWLSVLGNVITLNWLLQGLERFSLFATASIIGRLVTIPLTFWLVKSAGDVALAAAIQSAGSVLTGVFSFGIAWRLGALKRPKASCREIWQRLRHGADMFVAAASVTLFSATNAIMLASMAGTYQVGVYAAADKIKTAGNMVPAQINTVLYPRIAALFADRRRAAAELTAFGALATILASTAGIAGFYLLAGPITRLVLGEGYQGSVAVLQWLSVATLFGNLAYFLGLQVFVPFGMARKRSHLMLAAGCVNVAVAWVLIPRFGAIGAAAAFLVAEIAIFIVYAGSILRTPRLREHFMQLVTR
jgi:O-antigen/teichoic acid export membrane protein